MATEYTSLLGLALPVTGELSGTWGDTVNDYITRYVDAAVAGAQTISGSQTAVTLSTTNGSSLAQAGSGATGSAQYSILNCTGNPASLLTITAPATSKVYLVLNSTSTAQSVKVVGSGPTGVTVATGKAALIAWNGTDFALVASTDASKLTGVLAVANGGTGLSSYTAGDLVYASGATTISKLAIGAANTVLTSSGTAPQWSSSLDGLTTVDTTNLEVTNIKAKDGTAVAVLTDSTGALDISKAVTMSATTQNIALGTSQTSGTFTVGGAAQTGTQTFDQSTKAHTLNIGTGATENATTKTINIGTGGVSGSTTTMTIGSTNGTTTTLNGTVKLSGLTSGRVTYATTGGQLTDSANLTFDGTNLAVAGETAITGGSQSSLNALHLYFDTGTNTSFIKSFHAGVDDRDLTIGARNIAFQVPNGTEVARLSSSGLEVKQSQLIGYSSYASIGTNGLAVAGNVGVGTSSPDQKIQIAGGAGSAWLHATNTTNTGGTYVGTASTGEMNVYQAGSFPIVFHTASTLRMTLDSSGNLGLGAPPSTGGYGIAFQFAHAGNGGAITAQSISANNYPVNLTANAISSGSGTWKYFNTDSASATRYQQVGGVHSWYTAASGTAGNAISFTQAMTLQSNAPFLTGTNLDSGSSAFAIGTTGANIIGFFTNNTERGRISSDGTFRVKGAGTAGSTDAVQFSGSAPAQSLSLNSAGMGVGTASASLGVLPYAYVVDIRGTSSDQNFGGSVRLASNDNTTTDSQIWLSTLGLHIQNTKATDIIFYTSSTSRARITSGGDFLVGKNGSDVTVAGCEFGAYGAVLTRDGDALLVNRQGSDGTAVTLRRSNTTVGTISVTTTATAYNTSSDYRLKDNQQPLTGSGAFIDALQPKTWNWKNGGSRGVGFIAHEVQEVSPGSVVGEKDAVDADGKPVMQAMEYGSAEFIANIIAELQSLRARVAQLEQGA